MDTRCCPARPVQTKKLRSKSIKKAVPYDLPREAQEKLGLDLYQSISNFQQYFSRRIYGVVFKVILGHVRLNPPEKYDHNMK